MSKIHSDLKSEIKANPLGEFNVLITLITGADANSLKLDSFETLMENILLTKLDTKGIKKLARNKNVVSIELDSAMGIL